jgi:hypothetical protein
MPILRDYTAQLGGFPDAGGRRASASDFGGDVGAAMANFGGTIAKVTSDVVAQKSADEQQKVVVQSATIRAKYAKALDDASVSGADTDKIKQQMNDELSQVGSDFETTHGQNALNIATANTNLMFDEQANHLKIQRAGDQAKLAGQQFLTATSSLLEANPGYLPHAEENADALVNSFINIPPDKRAIIAQSLKQDVNMAAVMAKARVDPATARTELQAGQYNLTPDQRQYALREADFAERAIRSDQSYQRAQKNADETDADEKARDVVFKGIMGGTVRNQDILNNPDLKPATREHLVGVLNARTDELLTKPKPSNPVTKRDLWLDINAPDGDPRKIYTTDKIYTAVQAGKLNTNDANQLLGMLANNKDDSNRSFSQRLSLRMTNIGRAISSNPEYAAQPDLAASVQNEIAARAEQRASALRKAGKSPDTMLDPADKDYFFTPGMIKQTADDVKTQMAPKYPQPQTQEDYNALPAGTVYIGKDGNQYTKGAK